MSGVEALVLNVLPVSFSSGEFSAWVRPLAEDEDLPAVRETYAGRWTVQWESGHLYLFPIPTEPTDPPEGDVEMVRVEEKLRIVARLVTDALVRRFPAYEPLRQKPFTFLGRRRELMREASEKLGVNHPLLPHFRIWPKYELDGRVMETHDGAPFVGVSVDLSTRWEISADLGELAQAGVELSGLYVVRREPDPEQRRLVGRIGAIQGGTVELTESTDGSAAARIADVMLEGRREAFDRCLKALLGPGYERYDGYRERRVGELLAGPPLLAEVRRVGDVLREADLPLTRDLTATVWTPCEIANSREYKSAVVARQLDYCFDAARSKRERYAWPGLVKYGPFSRDTFARPSPRLLVVFPQGAKGAVENFICLLRDGVPGHKGFEAGMTNTFGLLNPRFDFVPVAPGPATDAAARYGRAITAALTDADLPDAAVVIVTDEDGRLPDASNPYLHSKALFLMAGVPTQEARLSTITRRPYELQYVLQNVATALYAKMKGVPWTIDSDLTIADELVIGVGTAELSETRVADRQRFVGITTVFRGDGNYLLGQLSRESTFDEYPAVLRDSTRDIIEEIKARNGWQPGDTVRLIFHAARPPKNVDFAQLMRKAVDAIGKEQHVEFAFLTVSHDHPFAVFDTRQRGMETKKGRKGELVPDRGVIVQSGKYARLVCTAGVTLVKRPGLPMARPLQVHLHRASTFTDLHYLAEQVLKFTSLSWRSTQPSSDPVTIYYSELIARLLVRLKAVPGWSPALLDARLRTSKWFI